MTDTVLSASAIVSRSTRIAQRLFDGRMLVITVDDSKLHRFNEVGTFIWEALEKPTPVGDLAPAVSQHFEGCTPEQADEDVTKFVALLVEKGLAAVAGADGGSA